MAFIQCNFYSQALYMNTNINVVIPTPNSDEILNNKYSGYFEPGVLYQTLYLLHGAYGDYSDWMRGTSIERYAQDHKLAVVMPSAANSFYQDMHRGERWLTYITEELPRFARTLFPLSDRPEDNFTAGLSMGGYGALKVALTKPESYAAAASLSGAVDICFSIKGRGKGGPFRMGDIFETPEQVAGSGADLFAMIDKLQKQGRSLPKLFLSCGVDDFIYPGNITANARLKEMGVDFTWEEHPGIHDWVYWDSHIQRVLDWLPLNNDTIKP